MSQLSLILPAGGSLIDLMAPPSRAAELKSASRDWPSWTLTPRQLCDLELLLTGGFSPLRGFLGRRDYDAVVDRMRLADGTLWPIPVVLDLPEAAASALAPGAMVALRDAEGTMLAAMRVDEIWQPDREAEAARVYGTSDDEHPGVRHLRHQTHPVYVSGPLEGMQLPIHHDFRAWRRTPAQLRDEFTRLGWQRVVAFQTRNPIHRAHFELTVRAAQETGANLLIHPVVGQTRPADVDHYTRVRCYQAILPYYPPGLALLSLLPLAMRMAGPREAVWHAIIRRNFGCTHLVVGRDHAGPGKDRAGKPFYGELEAQELVRQHERELGVAMVAFEPMVYLAGQKKYVFQHQVPAGETALDLSGTELRRRLQDGSELPDWFTFPEVARELRARHPPRHAQGFTLFFTGLPSAGKSTIAGAVVARLLERGGRPVTHLDGDRVRALLSSELGFSQAHRELNIRRIGFVAAEVTRHGGVAICAAIAPHDRIRKEVRAMVAEAGGFVLVHVATPLDVCEARDPKGLYAKARAGVVKQFTGISDPYDVPTDADVVLGPEPLTPEDAADRVMAYLAAQGYVGVSAGDLQEGRQPE